MYSVFLLLATLVAVNQATLPEEKLDVPQLIRYWGYPVEIHQAVTDDGYELILHRIPYGRQSTKTQTDKPVIFLQHGLLCSSSNWVTNLPSQSLAFMLADVGFDVWMGNVRGNTYSKTHTKYATDSDKYWDFSFDEMAKYDLPAMINYTLSKTGKKQLYYVGHSQGTMMAFAGLSQNPTLRKQIKTMFALAPVARLSHTQSPIKYATYFETGIDYFFELIGVRDFLPNSKWIKYLANKVCSSEEKVCENVLFLLAGKDQSNLNKTRTPVYFTHTPAGTSVKNLDHFAQIISDNAFQKYDYGYFHNPFKYGSLFPPSYNLKAVTTPVALFVGQNDWLADPKDVDWLRSQLPNVISHTLIPKYNHLDFIWGLSARRKVYKNVIRIVKKFETRSN